MYICKHVFSHSCKHSFQPRLEVTNISLFVCKVYMSTCFEIFDNDRHFMCFIFGMALIGTYILHLARSSKLNYDGMTCDFNDKHNICNNINYKCKFDIYIYHIDITYTCTI